MFKVTKSPEKHTPNRHYLFRNETEYSNVGEKLQVEKHSDARVTSTWLFVFNIWYNDTAYRQQVLHALVLESHSPEYSQQMPRSLPPRVWRYLARLPHPAKVPGRRSRYTDWAFAFVQGNVREKP